MLFRSGRQTAPDCGKRKERCPGIGPQRQTGRRSGGSRWNILSFDIVSSKIPVAAGDPKGSPPLWSRDPPMVQSGHVSIYHNEKERKRSSWDKKLFSSLFNGSKMCYPIKKMMTDRIRWTVIKDDTISAGGVKDETCIFDRSGQRGHRRDA